MGKTTGFMEYPRENMIKAPVASRIEHFREFEHPQTNTRVRTQAARCMDCGIPFCNWACPVDNLIPDFNHLVYEDQWKSAYESLNSTNNFPEFTGRICPAPCEPACTADIVDKPIAIKHIELAIIENAFKNNWVKPKKINKKLPYKIAIIGSGPAGLAAADNLNKLGFQISVFEKNKSLGGLLTYGIPDFKLEKWVVERRIDILRQSGINFTTDCEIGKDYDAQKLLADFDVICMCCGAEIQRKFDLPGHNKQGVYDAISYLTQQNRNISKETQPDSKTINAQGKHVVVIGGGDTGSDCVGTAIRQKAKSVTQIQLHKKPPLQRDAYNPWPYWPKTFQTSSSHEEGCIREFSYITKSILGDEKVTALELEEIVWPKGMIASGQRDYKLSGKIKVINCDVLISALGFEKFSPAALIKNFSLDADEKGVLKVNNFATSNPKVFVAGDMLEGANLVVTAIASGRKMAAAVCEYIEQLAVVK